jgi:hypothetical protein
MVVAGTPASAVSPLALERIAARMPVAGVAAPALLQWYAARRGSASAFRTARAGTAAWIRCVGHPAAHAPLLTPARRPGPVPASPTAGPGNAASIRSAEPSPAEPARTQIVASAWLPPECATAASPTAQTGSAVRTPIAGSPAGSARRLQAATPRANASACPTALERIVAPMAVVEAVVIATTAADMSLTLPSARRTAGAFRSAARIVLRGNAGWIRSAVRPVGHVRHRTSVTSKVAASASRTAPARNADLTRSATSHAARAHHQTPATRKVFASVAQIAQQGSVAQTVAGEFAAPVLRKRSAMPLANAQILRKVITHTWISSLQSEEQVDPQSTNASAACSPHQARDRLCRMPQPLAASI